MIFGSRETLSLCENADFCKCHVENGEGKEGRKEGRGGGKLEAALCLTFCDPLAFFPFSPVFANCLAAGAKHTGEQRET